MKVVRVSWGNSLQKNNRIRESTSLRRVEGGRELRLAGWSVCRVPTVWMNDFKGSCIVFVNSQLMYHTSSRH